jgi:hypothetical protein
MFLNGNFVALTAFKERYGVQVAGEAGKTIETKWQSSLFQAGQCGAFVGVFMAGPITNRLGYRLTTLLALVLMNATIFISFFVSTHCSDVEPEADSVCLGRLTRGPRDWPGVRGHPLGPVHRKLARLCLRGRSSCSPRCLHCYPADGLVYWWHNCGRCELQLQQAQR